jgi:hypothetical protein
MIINGVTGVKMDNKKQYDKNNKDNDLIKDISNRSHKSHQRKIEWKRFAFVLVITIAVFVTGLFFGNTITQMKFDTISNTEQSLRLELLGLDLQSSLYEQNPCEILNDTDLSKNLDEFGNKVSYLENIHGTNDIDVLNSKTYYSLLQIRHFMLKTKAMKECNVSNDFILFFYSNEKYCEKDCKEQGYVITNIREHRNTTSAYSFDINIKNPALDTLKSQYNVGNIAPVVVINGKTYYGFQTKEFIENKLINK